MNKMVDLGTDTATLFVFHPEDLREHADDLIDWHTYDFVCHAEFEVGHLIGFTTGSDGGYRLRLTDGDLTPAEAEAATGKWAFGYEARHGRVLVDNGDYPPRRIFPMQTITPING